MFVNFICKAVARVVNKKVLGQGPDAMPTIDIFASSGEPISSFLVCIPEIWIVHICVLFSLTYECLSCCIMQWEKGNIINMAWTHREELAIILEFVYLTKRFVTGLLL